MNPWNTQTEIVFDDEMKNLIVEHYNKINEHRGLGRKKALAENPPVPEVSEYLRSKYHDDGCGIKLLARALGVAYTPMRSILRYNGVELRKGRSVTTELTRKLRSDRVTGDANPWYDWSNRKPDMHAHLTGKEFGVQGYYATKVGKYVWLRSAWEYIYAKWLDSKGIEWEIEHKCYTLENGEMYRPDFSIFESGKLVKIVEVKGYKNARAYKTRMLNEQLDIPVELVTDISLFTCDYHRDLAEWKIVRLSKHELPK